VTCHTVVSVTYLLVKNVSMPPADLPPPHQSQQRCHRRPGSVRSILVTDVLVSGSRIAVSTPPRGRGPSAIQLPTPARACPRVLTDRPRLRSQLPDASALSTHTTAAPWARHLHRHWLYSSKGVWGFPRNGSGQRPAVQAGLAVTPRAGVTEPAQRPEGD